MTKEEIKALLNDIESDRVERTISTTNTTVMVTENRLPRGERATEEAIANGLLLQMVPRPRIELGTKL